MKIRFHYTVFIFVCATFLSCEKDNYDEPASQLTGRLVYNGEPIGVERNQVPFELYQFGFGRVGPIGQTFAQDGSYSALLFDGTYKLIIPNGQGPFMWTRLTSGAPDSLTVNMNGNQTLDLQVMPFYMIRNPQFSAAGGKVTATFSLEKIVTDANAKNIERVELYLNKTQFVSRGGDDNLSSTDRSGGDIADPAAISLTVDVPTIVPTQNYIFARIGVKIDGVEDRIYSQVQRIDL